MNANDTFRVIRCDDAENLPALLNNDLPASYRVRFAIPRWPGVLVIAEYWHDGIVTEMSALHHSRDEYLAIEPYHFEEVIGGVGYQRIGPGSRADWCDDEASLGSTLNRNADQGFRPRFVIPRDARYLVISEMAQDDDTPVIRIPGHLIAPYGDIRMEHPDFDALARRAGYRIPD